MPIRFNSLLKAADIQPERVRLIRHQDNRARTVRSPYVMWREYPDEFMAYQSQQGGRAAVSLGKADFWAVFVVTPAKETLFAGLYHVGAPTQLAPAESTPLEDLNDVVFDLSKSDKLKEFEAKVIIDWGSGYLAWHQRADQQDKCVVELRNEFKDPIYPGHLHFLSSLSEIEHLPGSWRTALGSVQGVYVLTCPNSKLLYVGSATGKGGFYERWCQHARKGGDAAQLQIRDPSNYQVSILEVAASNVDPDDIVRLEHLWMRKLQTAEMGLNSGKRNAADLPPLALTERPHD